MQQRQRTPRLEAPQQDAHRTLAAEAEPPDRVIGAAAVVMALEDAIVTGQQPLRVFMEVAFQAAAAQ